VVIFVQENHTFDSLFAGFPGADGEFAGQVCPEALPADPPHQHPDALTPGGATTKAARCSYSEEMAPNYWQMARQFTLCDRFFSDVRGPSHPNYFMLMAAQTPIVNTPFPTDLCPDFCLDIPTLPNRLDERGLTWRDYAGVFTSIKSLVGRPEITLNDDAGFFRDAREGNLPNVAWLNSAFLEEGYGKSGHPPAGLCAAENYAVEVVNAIIQGRSGVRRRSSWCGMIGGAFSTTWSRHRWKAGRMERPFGTDFGCPAWLSVLTPGPVTFRTSCTRSSAFSALPKPFSIWPPSPNATRRQVLCSTALTSRRRHTHRRNSPPGLAPARLSKANSL
jgi:hypothetical protein